MTDAIINTLVGSLWEPSKNREEKRAYIQENLGSDHDTINALLNNPFVTCYRSQDEIYASLFETYDSDNAILWKAGHEKERANLLAFSRHASVFNSLVQAIDVALPYPISDLPKEIFWSNHAEFSRARQAIIEFGEASPEAFEAMIEIVKDRHLNSTFLWSEDGKPARDTLAAVAKELSPELFYIALNLSLCQSIRPDAILWDESLQPERSKLVEFLNLLSSELKELSLREIGVAAQRYIDYHDQIKAANPQPSLTELAKMDRDSFAAAYLPTKVASTLDAAPGDSKAKTPA